MISYRLRFACATWSKTKINVDAQAIFHFDSGSDGSREPPVCLVSPHPLEAIHRIILKLRLVLANPYNYGKTETRINPGTDWNEYICAHQRVSTITWPSSACERKRRHISGFCELSSSPIYREPGLPTYLLSSSHEFSLCTSTLSIHLSIQLSIYPSVRSSVHLSVRPPIRVLVGAVKSHECNYQPRKQATRQW